MKDRPIEKNIPIQDYGRWPTFFRKLELGDSFIVESNAEANCAYLAAKRLKITLVRRTLEDRSIRMWRTG